MKPARAIGFLLAALITVRPGWAAESGEALRRIDWYAVPLMGYNTDNGLGFGARAELALKAPGFEPHAYGFMAQVYISLKDYHYHLLRYDHLHLGGSERLRLTVNGVYRQWGQDGYWGLGNMTLRDRAFVGEFAPGDPAADRYQYKLIQPFLHAALRIELAGKVHAFTAIHGKLCSIKTSPGSLLEEERPLGVEGGFDLGAGLGLVYDSRRPEADPQEGIFAELSGFGAIPTRAGPAGFAGLHLTARGYWTLFPWLVLAARVMNEWMFGDVPFYEMVLWHGSLPVSGFGGFEAVRGLPFGRFRAPHRAVGSLELRFRLFGINWFKRPLDLQLGLFGDGGLVYGEESAAGRKKSDAFPIHMTGGFGLRLVFAESFVARLDAGFGNDPIREPNGTLTDALTRGLYLTFGQAF